MISKVIDLGTVRIDDKALFASATVDKIDNYRKLTNRIVDGDGKDKYRFDRLREELSRLQRKAMKMKNDMDEGGEPSWTDVAQLRAEVVEAGERTLEFLFMLHDWPENKWCYTCGQFAHLGSPLVKHDGHDVE